ncbi:MAG: hypothetical protein M3Q09_11540, partial [Gemmatimonadota bacterium]|nr:hypothetical protein [Gemmatimonadota bacterium]
MNTSRRYLTRSIAALVALTLCENTGGAQLVPNDRWYTIETEHFRVHFTRPLEAEARRGAVNAERAFAQLATELIPPRGKVDLVIADNVDYVNGYATPYPTNRIVVYAHPPVDAPGIRNYDDWSALVITHELAHIFHLDRAGGLWKVGRAIFGRHPVLFPNIYQPAWVIEGLAVYYESRITGAGRLEGAEHYMVARAAAEARRIPRLGELSRSTSRFPEGETVYAYGGFVFDHLSRTRGPGSIARFLDITSSSIFPLSLNARAKKAFGVSFENSWKEWSDSLTSNATVSAEPMRAWRELTKEGRYVGAPRWLGDSTIVYTAATGREVTSAYIAGVDGRIRRIGRRNGLDANVPLADGGLLYSQGDYVDAFHFLNDLYIEKDGRETRLTTGARLWAPDARRDGSIVAVQGLPGTTRIVRVSADGKTVVPITVGDAALQWSEPRWSPDGRRIAAIRIRSTGVSELVVLDTLGSVVGVPVSERAIVASPSWGGDDRLFFTSTRTGVTQAYTAVAAVQPTSGVMISSASTGLLSPEPSPDASAMAALHFRYDGYHLGIAPLPAGPVPSAARAFDGPRSACANCRLTKQIDAPITVESLGPARRYSAWQSLIPRYWEPVIESTTGEGTLLGAATSANDIVDRHSYFVQALFNTSLHETHAFAAYQYRGFGQPFVNLAAEQSWEHFPVFNTDRVQVGDLARRARIYQLGTTFTRPRVRTFASFSIGGDIESRDYGTDPDTLLSRLPAIFGRTRTYPSVFSSASWSNARRPGLSISREDGVALSATARQRWVTGTSSSTSRSVVAVAAGFRSLDLPGFAHHVLAVRGAAGFADRHAISAFSAGGLSGTSLEVLAGINVGDERRTFGVRG